MNKSINASISTESYLLRFFGVKLNACQAMIAKAIDTRRDYERKKAGRQGVNSQDSTKKTFLPKTARLDADNIKVKRLRDIAVPFQRN